ncbi:MAG: DEAD/DEAH box helicase [Acidobacteriota bacterium]|nr:DEAD/DEAH box helicase [Acidobacteriota bacterium]
MKRRHALELDTVFHPAVAAWFTRSFGPPTAPQSLGWPAIARGESTLILAPTGSGKTLAAFLWAIERVMFEPAPPAKERCRVLYVSPLKALAVDVERNLRAPLAGIANAAAARGDTHVVPIVGVRTGDTPQAERAKMLRQPADILITTPESLFLVLTSNARETLRSVHTVIIDEIHALVPGKRGAHLALSLERLEELAAQPVQRIGLSATQRPLDEVARFLGGASRRAQGTGQRAKGTDRAQGKGARLKAEDAGDLVHDEFTTPGARTTWRPVTIIDTGERKQLSLTIEVPVEDMARLGETTAIASGPAAQGPVRSSIWAAIHPRLLELIRQHRSTLLFVNSRRLSERLAGAINDLAGETIARAHHGSIARPQRIEIEDQLKSGTLPALVATSSLELGIDMGAIDLVIQIEAPPSVASGMQRIGRAGHQVGAKSSGVIVPKYRGDLVACAAVAKAMHEGNVEATRFPRNPLDVLAQQIVAMVATDEWDASALFDAVRRAAPFAELSRSAFDGLLDMLAGRYPSDDFADLRPRITWDRVRGRLTAREGAKRVAITNAGTIPDRGLYGVFLAGAGIGAARVGELDEEMVFETKPGETFVLGASTWRVEEITHDRVLVSPAPGQPGKMPFWKADAMARPLEFGRTIGALVRTLREMPPAAALEKLTREHDLDRQAAENLLRYLQDQATATNGIVPDDRTVLIERVRDELGDWRVSVLTPFGGRVHAPWAMAVTDRLRTEQGLHVETMWSDDGFVVRFPDTDEAPDTALMLPEPDEAEALVVRQLGSTAMFAAKFREAAGRALLLPRRRPGRRAPLWQQRKRAHDLLSVASKYGSFPILLETYRECLRDVFDMPALVEILTAIRARTITVGVSDSTVPSPFASSLLFGYVANYIYDGDAPLAERRAQALSIDYAQLKDLLGEAELRELLDAGVIADAELRRQMLMPEQRARTTDGVHDLLLRLGDASRAEIAARVEGVDVDEAIRFLTKARRAVSADVAGDQRILPVEYAARYRDALGVPLPAGLPDALLAPAADAIGDLARRFSRTRGPFTTAAFTARYGLTEARAEAVLGALAADGTLVDGEFTPGGTRREWCDPEALRTIRQRSLAKLRKQVEPVEPAALGRLVTRWQGVVSPRRGLDALLDAVEHLQGAALPASILETSILPSRVTGYAPIDLDTLISAGEVVWAGVEPLGNRDGRIALFLADQIDRLWQGQLVKPVKPVKLAKLVKSVKQVKRVEQMQRVQDPREGRILEFLGEEGAAFFGPLHDAVGGGYPRETVDALWSLVWSGLVTNDSLHPLRAFVAGPDNGRQARKRARAAGRPGSPSFRSRRTTPPAGAGRWSLIADRLTGAAKPTERAAALANQLLQRYGIVTRDVAAAEGIAGGFSAVYDVLRAMEEAGRIRRGYFVSGVAATQFAMPAALETLRSLKHEPESPEVVLIAAADTANPYGTLLKWPGGRSEPGRGPTRSVGASVIMVNGSAAAWIGRGQQLLVWLPEDEPQRSTTAHAVAEALARAGVLVAEINGLPAEEHPLHAHLARSGSVVRRFGSSGVGEH